MNHGENQFADGKNHINGIEGFWAFAKQRLSKFKGIPKLTFYLHLKETEFRYNNRNQQLDRIIKNMLITESVGKS